MFSLFTPPLSLSLSIHIYIYIYTRTHVVYVRISTFKRLLNEKCGWMACLLHCEFTLRTSCNERIKKELYQRLLTFVKIAHFPWQNSRLPNYTNGNYFVLVFRTFISKGSVWGYTAAVACVHPVKWNRYCCSVLHRICDCISFGCHGLALAAHSKT
jgi:hypothetical protein